jgi:hypothetical protein
MAGAAMLAQWQEDHGNQTHTACATDASTQVRSAAVGRFVASFFSFTAFSHPLCAHSPLRGCACDPQTVVNIPSNYVEIEAVVASPEVRNLSARASIPHLRPPPSKHMRTHTFFTCTRTGPCAPAIVSRAPSDHHPRPHAQPTIHFPCSPPPPPSLCHSRRICPEWWGVGCRCRWACGTRLPAGTTQPPTPQRPRRMTLVRACSPFCPHPPLRPPTDTHARCSSPAHASLACVGTGPTKGSHIGHVRTRAPSQCTDPKH